MRFQVFFNLLGEKGGSSNGRTTAAAAAEEEEEEEEEEAGRWFGPPPLALCIRSITPPIREQRRMNASEAGEIGKPVLAPLRRR
jgi:hypothetical protein